MSPTLLITGSSSGIGKMTAIHFARQGWNVAATMRDPSKSAEDFAPFRNIRLYALDVTDNQSIEQAIAAAIQDFGQIDILVNNAGFGTDGVFEAMNDEVIARQFDTNVFGLMRVTRAIIPHFRSNQNGIIIQIASMGGRLAFPLFSIYHSSKWAVEGFSESLQYELAPFGIQVKIVEPGAIKTEFYGRSRSFITSPELPMYNNFVVKAQRVNQGFGENGEPPEKVAEAIFQAAIDRSSRLRYVVGKPAPLLLMLRKLLPEAWFLAIVKNSYKK
jgi:NAD(P)-dependent dehydrogenase (short-subunit alcohol dehydrogenase family)